MKLQNSFLFRHLDEISIASILFATGAFLGNNEMLLVSSLVIVMFMFICNVVVSLDD